MVIVRLTHGIASHFRVRVCEWIYAAMMFTWGAIVYAPTPSFDNAPAFRVLAQVATEATWGSAVMAIGTLRLMALIINGTFHRFTFAAHGRAFTAMLGVFVWLQLAIGVLDSGTMSPALAVYPWLVVFDIYNTANAWSDVVWAARARRDG